MREKIFAIFLLGSLAIADGVFFYPFDEPPKIFSRADQRAFIYYEGNKETLILSLKYQGDASNFAWIIPVPSTPKVSKAPENFFSQVESLLYYLGYNKIRSEFVDISGMAGGVMLDAPKPVTIISRQTIGIYDVAILSSTDPEALYNWCKKEGYMLPASAPSILKTYIDKKWFFIAVKIDKKSFGKKSVGAGDLTPLMIEFTSNTIVYPLKISFLNREYLSPMIKKIDEWAEHPVIFREEGKELADRIMEQLAKERQGGEDFEKTLPYKLGFKELFKPLHFDDFIRRESIIRSILEGEFQKIARKENSLIELIVIAPHFVSISEETPKGIKENLLIPFTSRVRAELFDKYLLYEDNRPIFIPKRQMALTYIGGEVPYAFFLDDLFLTPRQD